MQIQDPHIIQLKILLALGLLWVLRFILQQMLFQQSPYDFENDDEIDGETDKETAD